MAYLSTTGATLLALTAGAAASAVVPDVAPIVPDGVGEIVRLALSGMLGGVVRWLTLREGWRQGLASVVVGAICAVYLGPLVVPLLAPIVGGLVVEANGRSSLSGFLIGAGGTTFSGFLIDVWRIRRNKLNDEGGAS